jgi:hypothetical protein
MANIKSAKKRVLIAQRNTERNVAFKTSIKTAVKKVLACAQSEDKAELNSGKIEDPMNLNKPFENNISIKCEEKHVEKEEEIKNQSQPIPSIDDNKNELNIINTEIPSEGELNKKENENQKAEEKTEIIQKEPESEIII